MSGDKGQIKEKRFKNESFKKTKKKSLIKEVKEKY